MSIKKSVSINFGKERLICNVIISPYISESYLQPQEGDIADFDIETIFFQGQDVSALIMELAPDLINEKILEELQKIYE